MKDNLKDYILEKSTNDPTKKFEDIKDDWKIYDYKMILDYIKIRMRCLCGTSGIKHCYSMINTTNGEILYPIGSTCILEIFPEMKGDLEYYKQKFIWDTDKIMGKYICNVCFENRNGSCYEKVCMKKTCIQEYYVRKVISNVMNILQSKFTDCLTTNIQILKRMKENKLILLKIKQDKLNLEKKNRKRKLVLLNKLLIDREQRYLRNGFLHLKQQNTNIKFNEKMQKIDKIYNYKVIERGFAKWKKHYNQCKDEEQQLQLILNFEQCIY